MLLRRVAKLSHLSFESFFSNCGVHSGIYPIHSSASTRIVLGFAPVSFFFQVQVYRPLFDHHTAAELLSSAGQLLLELRSLVAAAGSQAPAHLLGQELEVTLGLALELLEVLLGLREWLEVGLLADMQASL